MGRRGPRVPESQGPAESSLVLGNVTWHVPWPALATWGDGSSQFPWPTVPEGQGPPGAGMTSHNEVTSTGGAGQPVTCDSTNPPIQGAVKCYNYQAIGHIARHCPKPRLARAAVAALPAGNSGRVREVRERSARRSRYSPLYLGLYPVRIAYAPLAVRQTRRDRVYIVRH